MSMRTFINIYIFNFVPSPFSSSGEAGFTFGTFWDNVIIECTLIWEFEIKGLSSKNYDRVYFVLWFTTVKYPFAFYSKPYIHFYF